MAQRVTFVCTSSMMHIFYILPFKNWKVAVKLLKTLTPAKDCLPPPHTYSLASKKFNARYLLFPIYKWANDQDQAKGSPLKGNLLLFGKSPPPWHTQNMEKIFSMAHHFLFCFWISICKNTSQELWQSCWNQEGTKLRI